MADLVFDRDGKAYAKGPRLTHRQQAEKARRDREYWQWVDAKMARQFAGNLDEFRKELTSKGGMR